MTISKWWFPRQANNNRISQNWWVLRIVILIEIRADRSNLKLLRFFRAMTGYNIGVNSRRSFQDLGRNKCFVIPNGWSNYCWLHTLFTILFFSRNLESFLDLISDSKAFLASTFEWKICFLFNHGFFFFMKVEGLDICPT